MSGLKGIFLFCGKWLLLGYLLYVFVFGVLAYLIPCHAEEVPPSRQYHSGTLGPDRAMLVEQPKEAFGRRTELIRSAENTLDVCYHCVKEGETADCFFAELIKAADRGVHVRVILDGAIGGLTGEHKNIDLALRSHPNIEFRGYNPVNLLKPWEWNARLHDKFILADGRRLMLGGRNLGDEYFDPPDYEGSVTYDRDVVVLNTAEDAEESVVHQVGEYMELLWNAKETKAYRPLSEQKQAKGQAEQERIRALSEKWEAAYPEYYMPKVPAEQLAVPTNRITLVSNPATAFKKKPVLGASLAALLKDCTEIRIQTPYATANPHTLEALKGFAENGTVEYLTNSLASTPNPPAFSTYISQRKKFVDTNIIIHEYQSTDSIHGKSCTADGHLSVVGSFNLDDRSMYIDTETVLVIDSPAFYQVLNDSMETLFERSAEVGKDNEYLPNQETEIVEVPWTKRVMMGLVSVPSRIFRFLI